MDGAEQERGTTGQASSLPAAKQFNLDPYAKPPDGIRTLYKTIQQLHRLDQPGRRRGGRSADRRSRNGGVDADATDELRRAERDRILAEAAIQHDRLVDLSSVVEDAGVGDSSSSNIYERDEDKLPDFDSASGLRRVGIVPKERLEAAFSDFYRTEVGDLEDGEEVGHRDCPVYEHVRAPGLLLVPGLIPARMQTVLLDRMLHVDLQREQHKTNLHAHYKVRYRADGRSLFSTDSHDGGGPSWEPLDAGVHRPVTVEQVLSKKLRWVTFGGQYDWTRKVYPEADGAVEAEEEGAGPGAGPSPAFPSALARLVAGIFPGTVAEASILNFYSPGDTLSLHRDVAEFCARPLVSVSFGCECVFVAGGGGSEPARADDSVAVRLRSGDGVVMTGRSRFAWHGVPVVVPESCPDYLESWPSEEEYGRWRGWMKTKRVNLNVRQMWDQPGG